MQPPDQRIDPATVHRLIPLAEFSELSGITGDKLRHALRQGHIQGRKLGDAWHIRADELDRKPATPTRTITVTVPAEVAIYLEQAYPPPALRVVS